MTSVAFERLLYTDCRPGAGRGSGGGFQVQAQSPGLDSGQSALAVGWLLYEVQNAWIVQRRAVEDFPLGFAHSSDDGYGTSQSRYLGKEATGGRQGNHLADCLLTREAALYDTIRPAQLWRSPLWRAEPWETIDCAPYQDGLEPGPLTLDEVTAWVRDRPDRAPALVKLLSVLEKPDGPRVVLLTDDADEAMMWIAAATLLLPERRALDVSFKVFSDSPLRARQRVVAAPAELNPQLGFGDSTGLFILETATCTTGETESSDRAAFLVGKLTGDDDPYEVIDAVELAEELGAGTWLADIVALRTGWSLTRPDDSSHDPLLLLRWLIGATPEQRRQHGAAIAAMLLDSAPSAEALRWLDTAAGQGDLGLDPVAVRAMLLDAELAEVLSGKAAPAEVLPPVPIGEQARRDAESKLSSAILLSSEEHFDPQQIVLVLRLTHRHDITLDLSRPLQKQLHKFAVAWIEQPAVWDPRGSALEDAILDLAYAELREQFDTHGSQAMMKTLRGFTPYFADREEDPDDPVYCHLQAAVIAGLKGPARQTRLGELLTPLERLRQPDGDPARASAAAVRLQRALLQWGAVDTVVAVTFLTKVPAPDIDPQLAMFATDWLDQAAQKPDVRLLGILANLDLLGKMPLSDRLARLVTSDRNIGEFTKRAASDKIIKSSYFKDAVRLVCEADPAVATLRAGEILRALITTPSPDLPGAVLTSFPRGRSKNARLRPVSALIDQLSDWLRSFAKLDDAAIAAVWCVQILDYPDFRETQRDRHRRLSEILRAFDQTLSAEDSERWRAKVRRGLSAGQLPEWDGLFGAETPVQGIKQGINLWRTRS